MSKAHPVQAVVFDLGKVLLDFDYAIAAQRLAAAAPSDSASPVLLESIRSAIDQSVLLFEFETGKCNAAQFHERVMANTRCQWSFQVFCASFADIFTPIPLILEFHAHMRRRGLLTFVLSNTNEIAIRHIRQLYPFYSQFDGWILSYQHGAMKPQSSIYAATESACGLRGANILYLDDRWENIEAANRRQWRTIHHLTPENTLAAAAAHGLFP